MLNTKFENFNKKQFIYLIIGICLISFVFAIQITTFDNSLTSENLTFTGNENITRNISIPKNANVTSAFLNLSGYKLGGDNLRGAEYNFNDFSHTGSYSSLFKNWFNLSTIGTISNNDLSSFSEQSIYNISAYGDMLIFNYSLYHHDCADGVGLVLNFDTFTSTLYIFNYSSSSYETLDTFTHAPACSGSEVRFCAERYVSKNVSSENYKKGGKVLIKYLVTGEDDDITHGTKYVTGGLVCNGITVPTGSMFYLNSFNISSNSSIENPSIIINNTKIWNHTGEFSETFSPNKTDDFSATLNEALNNGKCNCSGCSISGTNCTIPLTFHSDTPGILEYSEIDINYDPIPFVYLKEPTNNSWSTSTETFICNATDEINLTNVTLYIWNSTGLYNSSLFENVSGITNSTNFTITFPRTDTYFWNCLVYNNGSYSNWYESNYTLNVDIDNPIINSLSPSDNSHQNTKESNLTFFYTPSHSTQDFDTCKLYSNWTGTWEANQTNSTLITKDVQNNFTLNLSGLDEQQFKWTIWCNVTPGGNEAFSQSGNYTFTVDTIFPNLSLDYISTTAGTQTFQFNSTTQDTNLGSCKYSIYDSLGAIDGLNENITFTCNTETSPTTTAYGTFNLTIYSIDLAGNENSTTLSFTTSASTGGIVGGGGGTVTTIVGSLLATNFSITTLNFKNQMDISLAKDSVKARTKEFFISNEGSEPIEVEIVCNTEEVNISSRNLSICDYVRFSNTTFTVSPNLEQRSRGTFEILTPPDSENGEVYYFNILAVRTIGEETRYSKLSTSARVSRLAILYKWSYFLFQDNKLKEDKKMFPVAPISIIISLFLFIVMYFAFRRFKYYTSGFFLSIGAFILSFILLLMIL